MARRSVHVTYKPVDCARIPDDLVEGAALLTSLGERGVVDAVGERLRIRRQGGYAGLDVWLVLLLFFSTGASRGFRGFWDLLRPVMPRLAALAGRRRLPSPASVSRALDAVEPELLREASGCLLTEVGEVDEVLRHPVVRTQDACGQDWHVFDLDPTVTTLRHRALPADDDLPEPRRRSAETGAPGHSGRKRGNIQHRRVTVQHAGSGVWVHAHLSPGNGEGMVDFVKIGVRTPDKIREKKGRGARRHATYGTHRAQRTPRVVVGAGVLRRRWGFFSRILSGVLTPSFREGVKRLLDGWIR